MFVLFVLAIIKLDLLLRQASKKYKDGRFPDRWTAVHSALLLDYDDQPPRSLGSLLGSVLDDLRG